MQPILIDLDGTCDFLFAVRMRGVIVEANRPSDRIMEALSARVRRSDFPEESELRRQVGLLAQRLVVVIFGGCSEWTRLLDGPLRDEPLSRHEAIVLIYQYLAVATKFRGGDITPYANGSFSLIAEDDGVTLARQRAAESLPPGRVVGARATGAGEAPATEPQQGAPAAP